MAKASEETSTKLENPDIARTHNPEKVRKPIERLILTVKKEESVWNIHSEAFLHTQLKAKAWHRITQELRPDWSQLSPIDQEEAVENIKKRWTQIKEYYKTVGFLKKQYFSKSKSQIVRRKCVFNDILGFLDPTISITKGDEAEQLQLSSLVVNESSSSPTTKETQNQQNIQDVIDTIIEIKTELSEDDEVTAPRPLLRTSNNTNEDFTRQNKKQKLGTCEDSLPQSSPNSSQCSMNNIPQPKPSANDQLIWQTPQHSQDESEALPQRVHNQQITLNSPQESEPNNFVKIGQPIQSSERLWQNLNRQDSSQIQATPSYLGANPNVAFLLSCAQEMDEMSSLQRIEFKSGIINLLKTIKYPS